MSDARHGTCTAPRAENIRAWAVATLTEAAYCLRAVRAAGLLTPHEARALLADAIDIVFSDSEQEGKPN